MPELPEVETTLQGIKPYIEKQTIKKVLIRHHQLRWPIPSSLAITLPGQTIIAASRRGKYLLLQTKQGCIILHLGMSGRLQLLHQISPPKKHDHIDIEFTNQKILRFNDPRRFGAFLWTKDATNHSLIKHLGKEPLTKEFSANYLWKKAQTRSLPIKSLIMDHKTVVGVGNIYATEALFLAGIAPYKSACLLTQAESLALVRAIKTVLRAAIRLGGTTLKDFANSEGKPGYFSLQLNVYGRAGLPCPRCSQAIISKLIGQRSSAYCDSCQN